MQTIHKYPIDVPPNGRPVVQLPIGAAVAHFGTQRGQMCIWAVVETENDLEPREFQIIGTGHKLDSDGGLRFIGTTFLNGGDLVFHLFEPLATHRTTVPAASDEPSGDNGAKFEVPEAAQEIADRTNAAIETMRTPASERSLQDVMATATATPRGAYSTTPAPTPAARPTAE